MPGVLTNGIEIQFEIVSQALVAVVRRKELPPTLQCLDTTLAVKLRL